MENGLNLQKGFAQRRLPWLIGGAALLIYLVTSSHWITFRGLADLARVVGWDWHPRLIAPLHYLLTAPIRWLPAAWQLVALNSFSAICSALSLVLLARSVALLPHDRTRDQRQHERSDYSFLTIRVAWLPPVFAALVCGLQMTFWENAVISSGEALDLLLFAYVVRCLLEFRLSLKESWLMRMALVYGLGMTNNYAMIGFFPAFLTTLIWIRGRSFFNLRFILRMAVFGSAGLSLYLLLPIVQSFSDAYDKGFWEMLRMNVGMQKNIVLHYPKTNIFLISLTSLLPIVFMGIRWPASFGDISAAGNALTNLMIHVIHGIFLLASLYVAFDPPFSPSRIGGGLAFLPCYYLGALGVGYFSGYFLLIFGSKSGSSKSWERPSALRRTLDYSVLALVWIAFLAVPAGMIYRNYPQLRINHGRDLAKFGVLAAKSLPASGAVVLSDDPYRLYAVYSALHQAGTSDKFAFVETGSLKRKAYQHYLEKRYPQRWPTLPPSRHSEEFMDQNTIVQTLLQVSQSNELFYLHPSFGYYFEKFYLKPRNLVYQMKLYPANSVAGPPISPEEIKENDAFWKQAMKEDFSRLVQAVKPTKSKKVPDALAAAMGMMYSRGADFFGVELQKAGDFPKAREYFDYAIELNPANPAAVINREHNQRLRDSDQTSTPKTTEDLNKMLEQYSGNWDYLLGFNGPVDDPEWCYSLAQSLIRGRNFRQAAQQLIRVTSYKPDNLQARVVLARLYAQSLFPEKALAAVEEIRALPKAATLSAEDQISLIQAEAWAYVGKGDMAATEKILKAAQIKYSTNEIPYSTLIEIYLASSRSTNAVEIIEAQLKAQPQNSGALVNYAAIKIQNKDFEGAISLLSRALAIQSQNPYALMNRAIAYLQVGKLDEAQRDYEILVTNLDHPPYAVYYGLGEIAFQKKNKKSALKNYAEYLKLVPPGAPEIKLVQARVKELKNSSF